MQKIRITQPGWEGFTGPLGLVEFADGVSVEKVPTILANQITGLIMCESAPEEGEDAVQLGVANSLVGGATMAAPVDEPLQRQTDAERVAEDHLVKLKDQPQSELELHTQDQLEALVEKDGLEGLRSVGKLWKVKDRSIPALIAKILTAQSEFVAERKAAEIAAGLVAGAEVVIEPAPEPVPEPTPEPTAEPVPAPEGEHDDEGEGP